MQKLAFGYSRVHVFFHSDNPGQNILEHAEESIKYPLPPSFNVVLYPLFTGVWDIDSWNNIERGGIWPLFQIFCPGLSVKQIKNWAKWENHFDSTEYERI